MRENPQFVKTTNLPNRTVGQMKPEIAILLGAHQLLQENPTLTEDKAFGVAAQNYYDRHN